MDETKAFADAWGQWRKEIEKLQAKVAELEELAKLDVEALRGSRREELDVAICTVETALAELLVAIDERTEEFIELRRIKVDLTAAVRKLYGLRLKLPESAEGGNNG